MKFRKSFKPLPGIKLNFSKNGFSTTVGVRGASVNIGKNGTYLNTGIPGTGIYSRKKIGDLSNSSFSSSLEETAIEKEFIQQIKNAIAEISKQNHLMMFVLASFVLGILLYFISIFFLIGFFFLGLILAIANLFNNKSWAIQSLKKSLVHYNNFDNENMVIEIDKAYSKFQFSNYEKIKAML